MTPQYPNRAITWTDGSAIPAGVSDLLLAGLQPGFEIEGGEFQWNPEGSLTIMLRLAVMRPRQKPRTWEIRFTYPANATTAVRPGATNAEREWFAMMIRNHIAEWLNGVPSIIESARLVT